MGQMRFLLCSKNSEHFIFIQCELFYSDKYKLPALQEIDCLIYYIYP